MLDQEYCKVFIIDDEFLIRQGIKHYIDWEEEGFQIVGEASNGSEALQQIEKSQPHIVITDIVMPVMDGEALTSVIKEKYPEIQVIVLSSFSNFDYVRSTFQNGVSDYILKPKLEEEVLLKTLKKTAKKIPNFHFINTRANNEKSLDYILDRLMLRGSDMAYDDNIINESFPENTFMLLDVAVTQKEKTNFTQIQENTDEVLKKYMEDIVTYPIIYDENETVFILNFNRQDISKIKKIVEQVANILSDKHTGIFLTLSKAYHSIRETKQNYEENLNQLKAYRFYFPNKSVLFHDELPSVKEKQVFNLNRFIEVLKHEDFDEAFDYLNGHISYLSTHITKSEADFKSFLGNIIFNVTVLLGNLNFDNEKLDKGKYQFFTAINESLYVDEAVACLYAFLDEVNEVIISKAKDTNKTNFEKLIAYIDQHYSEALQLKDVANHFHFNASYLSSYFSMHYHEGYNEYLNKVRIEKAKGFLGNKEISISEISARTGYSDHSYFCKVFKKRTGMSPSSYRRKVVSREMRK